MIALTDDELLAGFEAATLPAGAFTHMQHVRTAWLFVTRYGMPAALARFSAALRHFAESKGATRLYHETITWAFLFVVAERVRAAPDMSWPQFADAHPDLLRWKPSVLDRYYSEARLWSEEARTTFIMPDRLLP